MAAPANSTAAGAIELGPLPSATITQNVNDGGTTYTVWYKYTAQPGDVVIGVLPIGDLLDYSVRTKIWTGSPGSLVQYLDFSGSASVDKALQLPVTAGTVYYFECSSTGGDVDPAVLTIAAERAPAIDAPAGSIFINDEEEGYPLAILDSTDSDAPPLHYVTPFANGEGGHAFPDGMVCLEDRVSVGAIIYQDVTEIARVSFTASPAAQIVVAGNRVDRFYLVNIGSGLVAPFVRRLSSAGVFGPTTWTLPLSAQLRAAAVALDDTILYYVYSTSGGAIKRWDLVTDAALADLAVGVAGYSYSPDMHLLADGTILVGFARLVTTNPSFVVRRYDAAGAILNTYNFNFSSTATVRLALAIDDPDSFWVKRHATGGAVHFIHVRVSDGAILATLIGVEFLHGTSQGPTSFTPVRFGNAPSCPFWFNPNAVPVTPPAPPLPDGCPPSNLEPSPVTGLDGCPVTL